MPNSIDCVLPLHAKDFDRFELLKLSMRKYWTVEGSICVVTPKDDCEAASKLVSDAPQFVVRSETEILPELESSTVEGWWKQQAIKLAFHQFTDTEFYLTLDADCIAVRSIQYDDLVVAGQGLTQYEAIETHEDWYALSAIALDMPFPQGDAVAVTPFLFATENVANLCEYLEGRLGKHWSNVFARALGPTEYTLYHIFASAMGQWEKHHRCKGDSLGMFGNCIWQDGDQANWKATDSFEDPDFLFSVLQSNTSVSVDWIQERVLAYLEEPT